MAVDFLTVVSNLQAHVAYEGPLWKLAKVVSWLAGAGFGYLALMQLKQVGDNQRQGLRAPIMSFFAGSMMIGSPELIRTVLLSTFGGVGGTSALSSVVAGDAENKTMFAVMQMISFIGYVFFLRGIWVLKESGDPQRYAQSSVAKAVAILFAGMCAIYIDHTLGILANTFGFNLSNYISY